jgi:hypothetical protein|tara:strand:+ start:244 stop:477 length:234 start_codon:yes stop_codon:yes gene_type:complete
VKGIIWGAVIVVTVVVVGFYPLFFVVFLSIGIILAYAILWKFESSIEFRSPFVVTEVDELKRRLWHYVSARITGYFV